MLDPHRFLATALALFDDRGDSPTLADLPLDMWFRGHTLVCMRSAWGDANALYVGFKGGSNANVSHGHLDAGSFILEADGVRWAVDMGPDNYDLPGYFDIGESGRRWSYYLANSLSHNTLVIGGQSQRYPGGGEVTVFASTPARTHAVMDLSSAYRGQAGKVLRGVAMLDRCRVLLRDELQGVAPGTRVRWGMVTHATVKIAESTATLTQDGKALRAEILEPAGARFEIVPTEQAHGDTFMTRDSRMIAIEVAAAADGPTEVAVLLTPVGAHWQSLPPPPRQPLAEWKEAANE
jgi:hypothetical protein